MFTLFCFARFTRISYRISEFPLGLSANTQDERKLSVYDGDLITPAEAFKHYTKTLNLKSIGVLGVSVKECKECELPVTPDPAPFLEHVLIDFSGYSNKAIEKKAKQLKAKAEARGWLHQETRA